MFISTTITTDITLGQLADLAPGVPRSSEEDMVKFLQFRATASLGNDEVRDHNTNYIINSMYLLKIA